jgi:hypothetical protein
LRPRLGLGIAAIALVAVLLVAAPAEAQTGYGSTVSVLAGQVIKINGIACPAASTVSITLDGTEIATTTADSTGSWSADVQIPADEPPGTYTLNATCGGTVVFTSTVQVLASSPLPRTGASHVGLLMGIGTAAIVLGASFVLGSRMTRREDLTPSG